MAGRACEECRRQRYGQGKAISGVLVAAEFKLVLVEWLDSNRGEGWVRLEELESKITHCRSVGWLVAKDAESLTLASHLGDNPAQCCGDLSIPRRAVRKITPLTCGNPN